MTNPTSFANRLRESFRDSVLSTIEFIEIVSVMDQEFSRFERIKCMIGHKKYAVHLCNLIEEYGSEILSINERYIKILAGIQKDMLTFEDSEAFADNVCIHLEKINSEIQSVREKPLLDTPSDDDKKFSSIVARLFKKLLPNNDILIQNFKTCGMYEDQEKENSAHSKKQSISEAQLRTLFSNYKKDSIIHPSDRQPLGNLAKVLNRQRGESQLHSSCVILPRSSPATDSNIDISRRISSGGALALNKSSLLQEESRIVSKFKIDEIKEESTDNNFTECTSAIEAKHAKSSLSQNIIKKYEDLLEEICLDERGHIKSYSSELAAKLKTKYESIVVHEMDELDSESELVLIKESQKSGLEGSKLANNIDNGKIDLSYLVEESSEQNCLLKSLIGHIKYAKVK